MTTGLALKLNVSSPLWEHFSRDNQIMQKKQYGKSAPKDPSEIRKHRFQILLSRLSRQRCPTLPPVRSHEAAHVFACWQLVPLFHQVVISGNCCNTTHTDYVKSHMNTKKESEGILFFISFRYYFCVQMMRALEYKDTGYVHTSMYVQSNIRSHLTIAVLYLFNTYGGCFR